MRIGAGVLLARRYFLTSFKMTLRYRPAWEPSGADFMIVTALTHGPMETSTSGNTRTARSMAKALRRGPVEPSTSVNTRTASDGKVRNTTGTVKSAIPIQRGLRNELRGNN